MIYYLLKTRGGGVVPDYIQVRNEEHIIIGYFRADNIERGFKEIKLTDKLKQVKMKSFIDTLEYGKINSIKI